MVLLAILALITLALLVTVIIIVARELLSTKSTPAANIIPPPHNIIPPNDIPADNIIPPGDIPADNIIPDGTTPAHNLTPVTPSHNLTPVNPAHNLIPVTPSHNLTPAIPSQNIVPVVPPHNLTTPKTFHYGDIVRLQSMYNNNYLSSCNELPNCGRYNATLRTDNETVGARKWKISSTTKANGQKVLYGDHIQLINQYTVFQGKLGSCGEIIDENGRKTSCNINVVVGRLEPNEPSETWIVEGKAVGQYIHDNDIIKLKNVSNNILLAGCAYYKAGSNCGVNVALPPTGASGGSDQWKIHCDTGKCTTE